MPLYDENGDEVAGALPPEETAKLQEQMKAFEEKAKLADELDVKLKAKEEELSKLSNKDFNFKRLREKSEEEIETMKAKMSEKEKLLLTEVMETRKELDGERMARFEEARSEILTSLSGGDETLAKSIEAAEKELAGEAKTPKELEDRFRKAYVLARAESPRANPIFSGYSSSYREPNLKPEKFPDTDKGKESLKNWFPTIADKIIKK